MLHLQSSEAEAALIVTRETPVSPYCSHESSDVTPNTNYAAYKKYRSYAREINLHDFTIHKEHSQ